MGNLGGVAEEQGDADAAQSLYEESLALFRGIESPRGIATALVSIGRLRAANGCAGEAHTCLEEALALGYQLDASDTVVLAQCHLASLADRDATDALSALGKREERLEHAARMESRFLLWRATHDPAHLTEAKRLLDHLVDHAPEEYREAMLTNVRLNREVMEAWSEHGGAAVE